MLKLKHVQQDVIKVNKLNIIFTNPVFVKLILHYKAHAVEDL